MRVRILRAFWVMGLVLCSAHFLTALSHAGETERPFWSFQRLAKPPRPPVRNAARVATAVDAFVLAKLEAKGLGFAPEADRRTLIRRLSLDLIGLPPTPEEVQAFLEDLAPSALERLVDRLLASPHFGVRWARHWLDVAGYVDTVGFDVDADNIITSEGKWRYRDYVVRAFNTDKPYDRFLAEQLAGDELVDWRGATTFTPEIRELPVATGFLRTAQDFTHEDVGNIPPNHYAVLHDTLEIVGSSVLALTLNCARCHDHKFDPIPQEDYYRLMALFTPAYNPASWKVVFPYDAKVTERMLPDVSPAEKAEIDAHNAAIDREVGELNGQLESLRRPIRERLFAAKLAAISDPIRADVKAAIEAPAEKRNDIQKYLAAKFEGMLKVTSEAIEAALRADEKAATQRAKEQIAARNARRRSFGKIQALFDVGPPPPTYRLVRGNHETPGPVVHPAFLQVLGGESIPDTKAPNPQTSGRRLALARWLTAPDTPASALTARVMTNRVWQHIFGKGIVPTPENFGLGGEPPTHPELLDWLASEFTQGGWRLKPLIRQIVTSSVYRQASQVDAATDSESVDPGNQLLGRMRLKRLDSEVIRDAILMVSGALDPSMGGPPVMLEARPDGTVVVAESKLATPTAKGRRSVYLLARRAFHPTLLTVFDQPVLATNCPERNQSAVPLQSLTLLNDPFLFEQSECFAARIARLGSSSRAAQVNTAFQLALGRDPTAHEATACAALLEQQFSLFQQQKLADNGAERRALVHLAHTLLSTSEFLYTP